MKITNGLFCCFIVCVNATAYAEVVTDGTMGAVQNLAGQMTIPQSLGTTEGNNLFHSFQTFNINTGESANFTGSDTLHNVISRVTGGQISTINGLLKSEVGNANFYFINPAGVTFGANAQVDVPSAFYVSTANSLKFADGKEFSASNPAANTLSIAEPSDFGFLGNQTGNIEIQGSQFQIKAGSSVSLSGGNININQAQLLTQHSKVIEGETICFPFGCISSSILIPEPAPSSMNLYALGNSQAEIKLNQPVKQTLSGQININSSVINTGGDGGGYLSLNAGDIKIANNSQLITNNNGSINADSTKGIAVWANTLTLLNQSVISSDALSAGSSGSIKLNLADSLTLLNESVVTSSCARGSLPSSQAGGIEISAKQIQVGNLNEQPRESSKIISTAFFGSGGGG